VEASGVAVAAGAGWGYLDLTHLRGNDLRGVAYGNGLFVAVGDRGTILTSPDGVNWTERTSGTNWLFGVTYGNGTFVAVGGTKVPSSPPRTG
jgi:hypothetical protein